MRFKYLQPDGRGILPRKWSVDKSEGAMGFVAERCCKVLIQHGWPCEWKFAVSRRRPGQGVRLLLLTMPETAEFLQAVSDVVAIEAERWRARIFARGNLVWLDGPHWLKLRKTFSNGKRGVVAELKRGEMPCPF